MSDWGDCDLTASQVYGETPAFVRIHVIDSTTASYERPGAVERGLRFMRHLLWWQAAAARRMRSHAPTARLLDVLG